MQVTAKYEACVGHGQCLLAAPEVFDLPDDADHVVVLNPNPDESMRAEVVRAIGMCPMGALSVAEDR